MAEAEKSIHTRTVVETRGVRLTLTMDEAEALVAVLNRVGGLPDSSPRGLIDKVLEALTKQGIFYPPRWARIEGSVYFHNGSAPTAPDRPSPTSRG